MGSIRFEKGLIVEGWGLKADHIFDFRFSICREDLYHRGAKNAEMAGAVKKYL